MITTLLLSETGMKSRGTDAVTRGDVFCDSFRGSNRKAVKEAKKFGGNHFISQFPDFLAKFPLFLWAYSAKAFIKLFMEA